MSIIELVKQGKFVISAEVGPPKGVDIQEMDDGLIVKKSNLHGSILNGHNDHRIVMALTIAALAAKGKSVISDAESISVSYPGFVETMRKLNARIFLEET